MTATATPQLRWSSTRDCPRKAVYEATDAPHRDRTRAEERTLYRGRSVGHDFVVALANENRWKIWVDSGPYHWVPPEFRAATEDEADVIAELRVQWEMGVGHVDLYVRETDTVLEVLSSQHATPEMMRSKLVQARGYARSLDAESIALAVVDPATLEEDRIIVAASSPQWTDLLEEVDERVAQVVRWSETGEIPARVCQKPGDAYGHFCLYAAHCFDGWQPAPLDEIADPETHSLVAQLFHLKGGEREVKSTLKEIEGRRKAVEEMLAGRVEPGKWQVGGFQVNCSPRSKETFKLPLARQDSRIPGELLDEFSSMSSWTVWTVEKNGAADVDPGEVPF